MLAKRLSILERLSMKIVRQLDERLWREFVDNHPQGNIFHTPEMFAVFQQTKYHHPTLWAVVDCTNNSLALLLPVQVVLMRGMLGPLTTRAITYGSLLCTPDYQDGKELATLLQFYKQNVKGRVLFTELRNLSSLKNIQHALQINGFLYEDHLNFIINLQRPVNEIWNDLDSNARSNVKKAKRKGVIVEEANSLETVQIAYSLLQEVYNRIQVPLADFSLFRATFEILQPQGMAKFFMARVEDAFVGTSIVLLYKDVVYAWYAGTVREYSSYKVGELLNWHVLEWGAQNSFSSFDFGGAGKPDKDYGPRKFKAKFGGTLINYGRNVCIHHPHLLKLSQWGYRLTRRFL